MWKDSIAEIFVPHMGSDGEEGEVATGYPVAPNRILTVYHAVFPTTAQRDENRPIEVRWHHPRVGSDWQPVQGIVWSNKRWDLALLECALPSEISVCKLFTSDQKPIAHQLYEAVGFPRIGGKRNEVRNAFHIQGSVYSMLEADDRFYIEEPAGPIAEENWKGASGSPVVVNGRILGVIVEVPPNLEAKRLQAVPMWKVLRDEAGFCLLVAQDQQSKDRQQRRDRMVQQIEHKLECADIPILDGLAAELPKLDRQTWAISDLKEKVSLLVSELLNLDVARMLNVCQQAHQKLANDLATKLIGEVVQIILPIIYNPSIVERVRVAHSDNKTAFLTLPVSHHTIAEIVMAGLDVRGTQYHPCSDEKKLPKGILCLPPPPETGIDSEGNGMVEEIDKHLKKFNWQGSKNFVDALDAYVVWKFTDSDSSKVKPQERIILAADAIEYFSNKKNLTYYLIINEPEDTQDRAALEQALITVRKNYPKLMCMILNSDFTIIREDRKTTLLPLGELLPKKQPLSTPTNPKVMPTMQSPQNPTFNITAGNVALSTGNGSPTQAGSDQTANINHTEGIKLSELHGLLGELGQAIDQVNSSKARETLNGHVVQAQTEMTKLEPDRNLLKSTLNTIKAGADMLEDGNKIIELCGKALTLLSGLGLL